MGESTSIVLSVLSLAGTVLVAWLTTRSNIRAKRVEGEASPYEQLSSRVSVLEAQVRSLLDAQWIDRAYIRALVAERPAHLPLPHPVPDWLAAAPQSVPTPTSIIQPPIRKE